MKNKLHLGFLSVLMLFALTVPSFTQQTFNTTIYFDYSFFLSNEGPRTSGDLTNTFNFRRAYFTYENKINDNLKFRFRYDADNTANITSITANWVDETISTKKDDKLRPFLKHLYLEYSNLIPNSKIKIGMSETLTFKTAEDRWGYRSVAKTLVDGYKDVTGVDIDASSADIGISLTGSATKYVRYGVMFYNGAGYSHKEADKYKKVAAQLQLVPMPGLSLVGYYDYEKQNETDAARTYKADAYFEIVKNLTLAGEYVVYQRDNYLVDDERYDVSGWSVFGRYIINPDKLSLFARYDSYEPNSLVDDNEFGLIIAGLDWAPFHGSMKLQPNIWFYSYKNSELQDDIIFNLTFFLSF